MGRPDDRQPDLTSNPGVITATLLSGVIAVAVAAAEWVGLGRPLGSPAGILWSLVALLGVTATVLGVGLELRRRRRAEPPPPAPEAGDRPRWPPSEAWPATAGRPGSRCGSGWACTPARGPWAATTTAAST